jgi:hypothetical protein
MVNHGIKNWIDFFLYINYLYIKTSNDSNIFFKENIYIIIFLWNNKIINYYVYSNNFIIIKIVFKIKWISII